jgi:hypothetical protein
MKKIWGGILGAIDWFTVGSPQLPDIEYRNVTERLAIVKQAHYVFR